MTNGIAMWKLIYTSSTLLYFKELKTLSIEGQIRTGVLLSPSQAR